MKCQNIVGAICVLTGVMSMSGGFTMLITGYTTPSFASCMIVGGFATVVTAVVTQTDNDESANTILLTTEPEEISFRYTI